MKNLKKQLTILLLALLTGAAASARQTADSLYIFRFVQGQDAFYVPWQGNGAQLEALVTLLGRYKEEVTSGRIPVSVDGYCTGLPSCEENLRMAAVRSNRLKSELITRTGLTEGCFTTANHNDRYRRQGNDAHKDGRYNNVYEEMRNVVVVTLRLPRHAELAEASTPQAQAGEEILHYVQNDRREAEAAKQREAEAAKQQEAEAAKQQEAEAAQPHPASQEKKSALSASSADERFTAHPADEASPAHPADEGSPAHPADEASPAHPADKASSLSLRTNLLYDAFLLPTLGIEWRISPNVGIKLDGSLSRWGGSRGKVQKMWLLNPEARWYLLRDKKFYLGASGSYGEYNIYKYMLGSLLKDDTGYQGSLWNVGFTLGYQLPLCRSLCLDFNLGLGYTRSEYDSFTLIDGVRTFKSRGGGKSFWGPTQAGVSLVWVIGGE